MKVKSKKSSSKSPENKSKSKEKIKTKSKSKNKGKNNQKNTEDVTQTKEEEVLSPLIKLKEKNRGKSKNKKLGDSSSQEIDESKNLDKKIEIVIQKKLEKFNLDYIYRREKYSLKNLMSNFLVSGIKKLIAKKLSVDYTELKLYYLDKELKDDKLNVYEMMKDDPIKIIEVKKESPNHENIVSLNTKINLVYKIKCSNIVDFIDFIEKIEKFFRDLCLESHYLCEPIDTNKYEVGFSCEDHSFQFRRFMMNIKKAEPLYSKSSFDYIKTEKSKVIMPKPEKIDTQKIKKKKNYFPNDFINIGPYITYEEMKKKEEKESKKKWLFKEGFSVV